MTSFIEAAYLPVPNIYFNHDYNFTILCDSTKNAVAVNDDCNEFIIETRNTTNSDLLNYYKYSGAFQPNYNATSDTGGTLFTLSIYITDPQYNSSNQKYDNYDIDGQVLRGTPTPFEQSLFDSNEYFISQPKDDIIVNYKCKIPEVYVVFPLAAPFMPSSNPVVKIEKEQRNKTVFNLLGILGGIWSAMAAFYVFLFGLGLIAPWGFIHRSRPFKNQYEQDLLITTLDLQVNEFDDEKISGIEEHENSSTQKRLDDLEKQVERLKKFNKFYREYIIDISFLNSIKTNSSPLLDME
ncbi:21227_t:CDS:2 [Dentiscutata erythropus]|uniref:21227_t:CDS:1 n=1 Tax=Dentiscutata erythropus TaxID=1348616 RepID=A0A9N9J8C4_9GLOM|nr:21227_t:CDS:2 [Dentiscutata erythropus]